MTQVLAIDTSGECGGFAIASADGSVREAGLRSPDGFGHVLFPKLGEFLSEAGVRLEAVDAFAAASGPGSFTGIRVALSAAKGLAESMAKPLFAVSNLEALAWYGSAPLRAVLIDARRDQVYAAVYDAALRVVSPETVSALAAWLPGLPEGELEFVYQDPGGFLERLSGKWDRVPRRVAPASLAEAVASVSLSRFLAGERPDPAASDANYVRRSDAELKWKDG